MVQKYLIDSLHRRVFKEWLNLAVLSGELPFPDFELRPARYNQAKWMPRGWSWVDPLKEVKAFREAEQAGYLSKADVISSYSGGDYDETITALAREQQFASDAGIKLDKDLDLTDEGTQLELLESEEPQPTRERSNGKRKRS